MSPGPWRLISRTRRSTLNATIIACDDGRDARGTLMSVWMRRSRDRTGRMGQASPVGWADPAGPHPVRVGQDSGSWAAWRCAQTDTSWMTHPRGADVRMIPAADQLIGMDGRFAVNVRCAPVMVETLSALAKPGA